MNLPPTARHPVLLIDAECVLCNRLARFVIRRDPKAHFRFAALGSSAANQVLISRNLPQPPPGTFMLVEDSSAHTRSDGALRVLAHLPFPWHLAAVFRHLPRPLRDFGYNLIARHRISVFGNTSECGLLTPEERSRFLNDDPRPPAI